MSRFSRQFVGVMVACWLMLVCGMAQAQTVFVNDTFTLGAGTSGTALSTHTPNTGGTWTQVSSYAGYKIYSGYAQSTSGTSIFANAVTPTQNNYIVEADVVTPASFATGTQTDTMGVVSHEPTGAFNAAALLYIKGDASISWAGVAAAVGVIETSATYHLTVSNVGNTVTTYCQETVGGTHTGMYYIYASATTVTYSATKTAFWSATASLPAYATSYPGTWSDNAHSLGFQLKNFSASYPAVQATSFTALPGSASGASTVVSTQAFTVAANGYIGASGGAAAIVTLTSTDAGAIFYSDAGGTMAITTATLTSSGTAVPPPQTFYYKPAIANGNTSTITATVTTGGANFSGGTPTAQTISYVVSNGAITTIESVLPANHVGATINVHITASGSIVFTTGTGATGTQFSFAGLPAGWSYSNANKLFVDTTHYTLTLTCPTAASPPSGATGAFTITDTTDSVTSASLSVMTPTLSISPASGFYGAGLTPTLIMTGTNTLWSTETAAGLFTVTGSAGASLATPTGITNTSASDVLTVGTTNVNDVLTDSSTGATATFTVSAAPATIVVTDSNLLAGLSPLSWYRGTTGHIIAYRPGAHFTLPLNFTATGAVTLNINATNIETLTNATANRPQIIYSIDSGPRVVVSLTEVNLGGSGTVRTISLGSVATTGNHIIKFWDKSVNAGTGGDVTNSTIDVTSVSVPTGTSTFVNAATTVGFSMYSGDSITEGEGMTGQASSGYTTVDDATISWPPLVSTGLNTDYCQDGIGGVTLSGYNFSTYSGAVVRATSSGGTFGPWTFATENAVTPRPAYWFMNLGTNGSLGTASVNGTPGTYQTLMIQARSAGGASCKVVVLIPFGQYQKANILSEFNYYQGATNATAIYTFSVDPVSGATIYKGTVDTNLVVVDLGTVASTGLTYYGSFTPSYQSFEGVHPDQRTSSELASRIVSATRYAFQPAAGASSTKRILH